MVEQQGRAKPFILGSVAGSAGGMVLGIVLGALFWGDVAALFRKITRRMSRREEQINFEILLQ